MALGIIAPVLAQEPAQRPLFRGGVDVVQLDVTVLDSRRQPVRGLTAADFRLLEDGEPRPIVVVEEFGSRAEPPRGGGWRVQVAPDVRTNELSKGRIVVLVLDDATLPPDPWIADRARQVARSVIQALDPDDLAAIVFTLDNRGAQELTHDRGRLLAAAGRFVPRFGFMSSGRDELYYRYSIDTLGRLAEVLSDVPGHRKTVIYVSTGIPVMFDDSRSDHDRDLIEGMRRVFSSAALANVNIHTIDPGGLGGLEGYLSRRRMARSLSVGFPNADRYVDYLETVAGNTGGRAVVRTNTPAAAVRALLDETATYYLLGFRPGSSGANGRFRKLEVEVKQPGVTVQARRGYYPGVARREGLAAAGALDAALAGLLPDPGIRMDASVAVLPQPAGHSAIALTTRLRHPPVLGTTTIDLRIAVFTQQGEARGTWNQAVQVPAVKAPATSLDYEVLSYLELQPGRYQIRIGAAYAAAARTGSLYIDADVPHIGRAGALSSIVLDITPALHFEPGDASGSPRLPVVPTTRREVTPSDDVKVFVRAAQGRRRAPLDVRLHLKVVAEDGTEVFAATDTLTAERFIATGSVDHVLSLPVDRLGRGEYLVIVESVSPEGTPEVKRLRLRVANAIRAP